MSKHTPDPKRLIDVIYVKRLERRLGRALTEFELEDHDEPIAFCFPDGHIESLNVPRLRFPHDVITTVSESLVVTDDRRFKGAQGIYEEVESALQPANTYTRSAA